MIDDQQLDLLVDGELTEEERRRVLILLDRDPDGWRRCALAFLESRSWREELRAMSRESRLEDPSIPPTSRTTWSRVRILAAMAACFLLALGLGLAIGDLAGRAGQPAALAPSTKQPAGPQSSEPATENESPDTSPPSGVAPTDLEIQVPYRYVTLPAQNPANGETESVRVPVVPQEYLGADWPNQLPSAVPDQFVQLLRRQGHDVVQQRHLVPLQASDGSRVVFPVDEVEILPVANNGYQ